MSSVGLSEAKSWSHQLAKCLRHVRVGNRALHLMRATPKGVSMVGRPRGITGIGREAKSIWVPDCLPCAFGGMNMRATGPLRAQGVECAARVRLQQL